MKPKIINKEVTKKQGTELAEFEGKIYLSNGTIVNFSICDEFGVQQWGGNKEELWITLPVVEKIWNDYVNAL